MRVNIKLSLRRGTETPDTPFWREDSGQSDSRGGIIPADRGGTNMAASSLGDDWRHQVSVVAIREERGGGRYPKVTARVGAGPPQDPNLDEEDDDDQ
jgi:hypothetical protein